MSNKKECMTKSEHLMFFMSGVAAGTAVMFGIIVLFKVGFFK